MLNIANNFYENLYDTKTTTPTTQSKELDLITTQLDTLSANILGRPLSVDEIISSINKQPNRKAPGPSRMAQISKIHARPRATHGISTVLLPRLSTNSPKHLHYHPPFQERLPHPNQELSTSFLTLIRIQNSCQTASRKAQTTPPKTYRSTTIRFCTRTRHKRPHTHLPTPHRLHQQQG